MTSQQSYKTVAYLPVLLQDFKIDKKAILIDENVVNDFRAQVLLPSVTADLCDRGPGLFPGSLLCLPPVPTLRRDMVQQGRQCRHHVYGHTRYIRVLL